MRVLHLATFLQGGAGRVIADLAVAQIRSGHSVSIVASETGVPGYGNYDGHLDELRAAEVPLHLVDSLFVREQRANLAVVERLNSLFPPGAEPHVFHAHAATPSAVALLFAGARHQPSAIVQTMHGWGVNKTDDQRAADVALMKLVDRVAVPSRHCAVTLTSLGVGAERIEIVPYGVTEIGEPLGNRDLEVYHAMLRARADGFLVLACVGTIGPRKNQSLLVEALRRIDAAVPTYCVFIGDGDVGGLQSEVVDADIQDRVVVHGYSRAARRLAAGADVLVLPSRSEGQPIAVLEAFCDGPLVLVSDIPELTELVDDGVNGFSFAAGNAESLSHTLMRISRLSPALRRTIQAQAHARYSERFSAAAMSAAYMRLYERSCLSASSHAGIVPAA